MQAPSGLRRGGTPRRSGFADYPPEGPAGRVPGQGRCIVQALAGGQAYGYVRSKNGKVKGGLSTVARLVLGTGRKQVVHYRDGDRLNLCRSNLYITKGNARGAAPCPAKSS